MLMKIFALVLYVMLAFPSVIAFMKPSELKARWYGYLLIGGYTVFTALYLLGVE